MPSFADVVSVLTPKERVWSLSYSRLCLELCSDLSYRRATEVVNAALHRSAGDSMKVRTCADFAERVGADIQCYLAAVSETVLAAHSFEPGSAGAEVETPNFGAEVNPEPTAEQKLWEDEISKKIEEINAQRKSCEQINDLQTLQRMESPQDNVCYISIDDIGVKHQKDTRKDGGSKTTKNVENTVVHIQNGEGDYYLTAYGMEKAFRMLVAFLLSNNLMQGTLVFFADGAKNIKSYIEKYFSSCLYVLILDWYHLKKKCKELISSSFKGTKEQRKEHTQSLLRMLWVGNVKEAILYLKLLDKSYIKSSYWLEELIGYLERKEAQIVCYALRYGLGLRVSSNRVEKANDLLVAQRQKHSGMSWSFDGSSRLASIAMVMQNNDIDQWLRTHSLPFSMPGKAAA